MGCGWCGRIHLSRNSSHSSATIRARSAIGESLVSLVVLIIHPCHRTYPSQANNLPSPWTCKIMHQLAFSYSHFVTANAALSPLNKMVFALETVTAKVAGFWDRIYRFFLEKVFRWIN